MGKILTLFVLCFTLLSCGGDGSSSTDDSSSTTATAPTISSVVSGAGVTLSTSAAPAARQSRSIATNTMTVTFDSAMDASSVTGSGGITLSCNDGSTDISQTVTVTAADADNKIFTVTPAAKLTHTATCTLTVTTNVKNSGGTALAAAAAYEFDTVCTASYDFSRNTMETCFFIDPASADYITKEVANDLMQLGPPLLYNTGLYGNSGIGFSKLSNSEDLTAIVRLDSVENLVSTSEGENKDSFQLQISCQPSVCTASNSPAIVIDVSYQDANNYAVIGSNMTSVANRQNGCAGNDYCMVSRSGAVNLKIAKVGDTYSSYYSTDGSTWTTVQGDIATVTNMPDTYVVNMKYSSDATAQGEAGFTAYVGQYTIADGHVWSSDDLTVAPQED